MNWRNGRLLKVIRSIMLHLQSQANIHVLPVLYIEGYGLLESLPELAGRHIRELFKGTAVSQCAFKADLRGNGMDGQLGISEIFLGFVDPVFSQILVQGFSCMFFKNLAEIELGKVHLLTDNVYGQLIHIVLVDVFQCGIDNSLLHRSKKAGFFDLMSNKQQLMDNLMNQIAGFHLYKQILRIMIRTQGSKVCADIVQRRNGNDPFLPAYHIIVELGMCPGENNIKISPIRGSLGKPQPGIAVGDHNMLLMNILHFLVLRILRHPFQNIKNNKFRIIGIAF